MPNKNNITYPPLFASGHYYSEKDFNFNITTVVQTVSHTTALKNNDGITLLYFRNGQGSIVVNSKTYNVKRGILICLASYHYYQLKPSNGSMEIVQCQLSYDTFLYMAANPYYDLFEINRDPRPLTSLLEGDMLKRTDIITEELVERTNKKQKKDNTNTQKNIAQRESIKDSFPYKIRKTEFFLCMRLMGILHKTHQKEFWN